MSKEKTKNESKLSASALLEKKKALLAELKTIEKKQDELFTSYIEKFRKAVNPVLSGFIEDTGDGKLIFQLNGFEIAIKPAITQASTEGDSATYKYKATHPDKKTVWGRSIKAIMQFLELDQDGSAVNTLKKAGWSVYRN
jgi:hypothetical protein